MTRYYFFGALIMVFIGLSLKLGFWQLERAEEKRQILNNATSVIERPLSLWQQANDGDVLTLQGRYEQKNVFLLDNQSYEGQVGYSPILPFIVTDKNIASKPLIFMVNLGWVKADINRNILPKVGLPLGEITIRVRVYKPNKSTFRLSENQYATPDWPKRIQYFSTQYFIEELNKSRGEVVTVVSYQTRIEPREIGAQRVHWLHRTMTPAKHQAYAIQWFALALLLLFAGGVFWLQQKKLLRSELKKGDVDE